MPDETQVSSNKFPGFPTLLTLVFAVAKLWGQVDWSWWWVLSPMWIAACLIVFLMTAQFLLERVK